MRLNWLLLEEIDPLIKYANILKILENQLGMNPDEIVRVARESDPTSRMYIGWILKQWQSGDIRLPEDSPRVLEALKSFHKYKVIPGAIRKDINSYHRFNELESMVDKLDKREIRSKREEESEIKLRGAQWYRENESYKILKVISVEAAARYAKNTKWCTSNVETAKQYITNGPLYIVFEKEDNKLTKIIQYTRDFSQIKNVLDSDFKIEDKKLAILMEPERYDAKTASNYAHYVLNSRWPKGEGEISKSFYYAPYYAERFIDGRWPEFEDVIKKGLSQYIPKPPSYINFDDPLYALESYVKTLRKKNASWPEGEVILSKNYEETIRKDPMSAYFHVIHNMVAELPQMDEKQLALLPWGEREALTKYHRWPEGEKLISTNAQTAYDYARNVIKGRWPEGEGAISKDPGMALAYAKNVVKGRWPDGEEAIRGNAQSAYKYAQDIVGGRWPEGEKAINKNRHYAYQYAKFIGLYPKEFEEGNEFDVVYWVTDGGEGSWVDMQDASEVNKRKMYSKETYPYNIAIDADIELNQRLGAFDEAQLTPPQGEEWDEDQVRAAREYASPISANGWVKVIDGDQIVDAINKDQARIFEGWTEIMPVEPRKFDGLHIVAFSPNINKGKIIEGLWLVIKPVDAELSKQLDTEYDADEFGNLYPSFRH